MAQRAVFFANLSAGSSFCPECGSLLVLPESDPITCDCCGLQCRYSDLPSLEVVTRANPREPSAVLAKAARAIDGVTERAIDGDQSNRTTRHRATVDEPCPKCQHPQLEFYTMQMRSADEGQTVFYECTQCGHKFSQNN
jgi:DNA-directed RNA polymerase I subunit RPA12